MTSIPDLSFKKVYPFKVTRGGSRLFAMNPDD
jgi:hypothetical protein